MQLGTKHVPWIALPLAGGVAWWFWRDKSKAGGWGNLTAYERVKLAGVLESNKSPAFLQALGKALEKRGATVPAQLATAKAAVLASPGAPAALASLANVSSVASLAASAMPQIQQGSTGAAVMQWQSLIGVATDGQFGPETLAKTRVWQAAHGLSADGIVGPMTWSKALSQ